MRAESESGIRSEKRCDLRRQQKMERGGGGSSSDTRLTQAYNYNNFVLLENKM